MTTPAVILARGLGSRMRRADGSSALETAQSAAADAGAKAMMPVGRPLVEHILTALADAGIGEAVVVIGPEHDAVREHFAAHPPQRLRIRFAEQAQPLGTADAVLAARDAVDGHDFLLLNGDTWYPPDVIRTVAAAPANAFGAFDADALLRGSNIPAERILAFALCAVDANGLLREIVEKPAPDHPLARAASRIVSMNLWHLSAAIFDVLPQVRPSPRGELEIQDAIRMLVQSGEPVRAVPISAGVLDLSTRADVATVTARLAGRAVAY
jgi:dTDP-glucose pyrophosphorylase